MKEKIISSPSMPRKSPEELVELLKFWQSTEKEELELIIDDNGQIVIREKNDNKIL